jgi:hypothetical protein
MNRCRNRWAVIVEERDRRTLLYGALVPRGHVEMAMLDPQAPAGGGVLIIERTPEQLRTFVVGYDSSGRAHTVSSASYSVASWAPSLIDQS